MLNVQVPEVLLQHKQIGDGNISFIHYRESAPVGRNLITFNRSAISFILSGQKDLYRLSENAVVNQHQGVVIPHGNSIIAERKLNNDQYSSLVVFFKESIASNFISKHLVPPIREAHLQTPGFIKFGVTPYLNTYINHLLELIENQVPLPSLVIAHKLEELLLVLLHVCPQQLVAVFKPRQLSTPNQLKAVVEQNLFKGLSLAELAFLCHRSLATFKRDFEKAYGTSPGKYIRERKLELASHALMDGTKAMDIAIELGYEELSNFNTAFKRRFGQTPNAYQTNTVI